jgi:hypothetical protein
MGDKSKLKTGNLGANAMEENRLNKHLDRLDKQIRDRVVNNERQQKLLAKNFHERLNKSMALAKKQENVTLNFRSNRRYLPRGKKDIHLINKKEELKLKEDENSPSLMLRKWNQSFCVPYKKEYSFSCCRSNTRPSTVLEVRSKMWQKVTEFCLTGRERACSAPLWLRDLRAPEQVERAHLHALEIVGIQRSLVQTPSRQPLIDLQSVRKWREKEKRLARCAVEEFVSSLVPYKLRPGPSQQVHDVNSLYELLSTPGPPLKHSWSSS